MAAPQNADHTEEHTSFIQTPKQLITVVVLAFVVPVMLIVMLVTLVTTGAKYDAKHPAMSEQAITQRIKPVGQVLLGDAAGGVARSAKSGAEIYTQVCAACHASGVLNAPKVGDNVAWAKLIKEGLDTIAGDAIKGIRQMPPRGGNPDLSDVEVRRAVVYMANQSGASWKEPEAPSASAPAAAAAPAVTAAAAPAGKPAADGKTIYDQACAACHAAGVAGAPKTGDKAGWAPRLKQGMEALYATALKGKGAMPPKGGAAQLSDADVKAAVDYLAGQAK